MKGLLCSAATGRFAIAAATALALVAGSATAATAAEPHGDDAAAPAGTTTPPWLLCAERDSGGALLKWCLLVDAEGHLVSKQPIDHVWSPHVSDGYDEEFGRLSYFRDGRLLFFTVTDGDYSKQRFGFIGTNGQITVPARYLKAGPFSEGRARVCDERGCGYIDTSGREVIPLRKEWVKARDFHDGRALVRGPGWTVGYSESIGPHRVKAPWSAIDLDGKLVLGPDQAALPPAGPFPGAPNYRWQPPTTHPFEIAGDFSGGVAPFTHQGSSRHGLIDTTGRIVAPANYSGAFGSLNGLGATATYYCVENKGSEKGVLSRAGRFTSFRNLLNTKVDIDCSDFNALGEGHSLVGRKRSWYAILGPSMRLTMPWTRRLGQELQGKRMHEGLIPITMKRKVAGRSDCYEDSYVDARGRFAFPHRFDEAYEFSEGLAGARVGDPGADPDGCWRMTGQMGFIDHRGNWVIPPRFNGLVSSFRDGRAVVHGDAAKSVLNGVWRNDEVLIDREGRVLARYSDLATPRPPR